MQYRVIRMLIIMVVLLSLQSCELVEGIFKAGVGVGVFIVVVLIAVIIFVISKFTGNNQ